MKELFFKLGGQKTSYTYRNLRMEKAIGFLRIVSYQSDAFEGRHEMMDRGNAVVVLPVDFVKREVYLVEQPRHIRAFTESEEGKSLFERARRDGWTKTEDEITLPRDAVATLEAPAGMIDSGETPEQTAVRELCEETGLIIEEDSLEKVASYYPSVGGTGERITAFFARLPENGTIRCAESLSDEDIHQVTVWRLGFDNIFAMLDKGEVMTASSNIIFRELRWLDKNSARDTAK
jgi:nudix-type nucleoside diphosphatase (YffH/AdpP family)